jgi:hypothetical protein
MYIFVSYLQWADQVCISLGLNVDSASLSGLVVDDHIWVGLIGIVWHSTDIV